MGKKESLVPVSRPDTRYPHVSRRAYSRCHRCCKYAIITYMDGIEKTNGIWYSVYTSEGRVSWVVLPDNPIHPPDPPKPQYEYTLRDHPEGSGQVLGNSRLMVADKNDDGYIQVSESDPGGSPGYTEILQENHYYAFGMNMEGPWHTPTAPEDKVNRYQYNGKELNDDIGLGWYDYGARYYDSEVGRFLGVDPMADEAPNWTAYRYAFNNPLVYTDPDGKFESRKEARQYRKKQGISWWTSSIKKQKDGAFELIEFSGKVRTSTVNDKEFGILKSPIIKPDDVIASRIEGERGMFVDDSHFVNTLRDGSEVNGGPTMITGTAPTPGLKGVKGKTISRAIGKGKRLVIKLIKKGDDATDFSKMHTGRGPIFNPPIPNTQPKNKWKYVIDLIFGNFDSGS